MFTHLKCNAQNSPDSIYPLTRCFLLCMYNARLPRMAVDFCQQLRNLHACNIDTLLEHRLFDTSLLCVAFGVMHNAHL